MSKKEETALAKVKHGALTAPGFMDEADFGGAGFEGADTDSFAIPFIYVLQKMSPYVDEDNPKYVQGAKAGMFLNTVTNALYDGKEGVNIVQCAFKRSFVRWGSRDGESPGFKQEITPEAFDLIKNDPTKVALHEGTYYVPNEKGEIDEKKSDYWSDTRSHFVLLIEPQTGDAARALLSLSSSQIKGSRNFMTALQQRRVLVNGVKRQPPTFANLVRMTSAVQTKGQNQWSVSKFDIVGFIEDKALFEEAKQFYKDIVAGDVQVDYAKADQTTTAGDGEAAAPEANNF